MKNDGDNFVVPCTHACPTRTVWFTSHGPSKMKQKPLVSSTYPTGVLRKTRTSDDATRSCPIAYLTKVAKLNRMQRPRKTLVWDRLSVPIQNAFEPLTLLKGDNVVMYERAPQRHPKNMRGPLPV